MKIGILTFHCAHNYGAVLQCYALQEYLKNIGHEVYIIDYRPNYLKYGLFVWYKWFSFNPIKFIKKIRFQITTFSIQRNRYTAFECFIKNRLNIKKIDLHVKQDEITCFVFGSDQIWRKNGVYFDPIYFGEFKAAQGHKLISYAASMGLNHLSADERKCINGWLDKFSVITVRETSLQKLLFSFSKHEIEVVTDPTFLLNPKEWDKIAISPQGERNYILIYQVIPSDVTYEIAKKAAKELNAEIIEIASSISNRHADHRIIYSASPEEFVGWIRNARFVITTSFHGTAFSIIYGKAFVSIKQNKPSDLRIASVLSLFNLEYRFIENIGTNFNLELLLTPYNNKTDLISFSRFILEKNIY